MLYNLAIVVLLVIRDMSEDMPKIEGRRSKEELPPCSVEVFDIKKARFDDVKDDVMKIEGLAIDGKGYEEDIMREDFENPQAVIILLRNKDSQQIIGYVDATPASEEVINIDSTALNPEYQRYGLVWEMMKELDEELKKRGYKYMTRDAKIEGGYAASVERFYGERIVEKSDHDSDYGPQRYMKIKF